MVHINVVGLRASGQTTICRLLEKRHDIEWIPRVTTRALRKGEGEEYMKVSATEFIVMRGSGEIIKETCRPKVENGMVYHVGILNPQAVSWPKLLRRGQILLSMFGTYSLLIKERYVPSMINVYLFVPPWMRRARLDKKEAETRVSFEEDRLRLPAEPSEAAWKDAADEVLAARRKYDILVVNDGTPIEAVETIERLLGLTPKRQTQKKKISTP